MIKLHEKNNGNNINILDKKECTGCSVCAQVCPHNCIKMIETKEGFHYPVIDEKLCTDCGLCVKKCHALNDNFKTDFNQEFYDVRANDEIRMKSSSGGMFTLIADYVFERGGFVCGASWRKDWLGVEHIIIDDKKDLDKLRGSKYVESYLGNIFSEIKRLLNDKKLVLFSGTPCQVSALNFYLGRDYENLITVDLLCNSVVPQKVWRKYLRDNFSDNDIKDIEYINFRDKNKIGWDPAHCIYIKFKYGEYLSYGANNSYIKLFLRHISVKEECLKCKYRKFERAGDITIGDYWGVEDNDDKGVSLVLVNSLKGKEVFEKINQSNFNYKRVYNISNGGLGNSYNSFGNREYFFKNIDNDKFEVLYNNSMKFDIGLVGFYFASNYGAILTYYALYRLLKNEGFSIAVIDTINVKEGIAIEFSKKYYNHIIDYCDYNALKKLNDTCDIFITASDQLWNRNITDFFTTKNTKNIYFLDFVDNDKKKIAVSTSIGDINTFLLNDKSEFTLKRYYLSKFDSISLREKSGADYIKNNFNIDADNILDPVFLLDINEYENLIKNSTLNENDYKNDKYIFCYFYNREYIDKANIIANKLNKKIIVSTIQEPAEDWLLLVKNADFIITDGFHGTCFSIIFNKKFICVRNDYYQSDLNRIKDILVKVKLENRVIPSLDIAIDNLKILTDEINYKEISNIINIEKDISIKWIKDALKKPKKKYDYNSDVINYLIKENKDKESEIHYLRNCIDGKQNWIKLFGIYNTKDYLMFYLFGFKISLKINEKNINKLAWWIPVRKWRDNFRNKFFR